MDVMLKLASADLQYQGQKVCAASNRNVSSSTDTESQALHAARIPVS
jgi:hypothetical protein